MKDSARFEKLQLVEQRALYLVISYPPHARDGPSNSHGDQSYGAPLLSIQTAAKTGMGDAREE